MSTDRNIIVDNYSYSYRFKNPYSFSEKRLIKFLEAHDFKEYQNQSKVYLSKGLPVAMILLQKEDNEVHYNPTEGILGIGGFEIEEVNKDMDLLNEVLVNDLNLQLTEINYSEIISRIRVESKNTALGKISGLLNINDKEKIKNLVDDPIVYSFALCPKGLEEKKDDFRTIHNWFHFQIVPFVPNPKYYLFNIVYRNQDLEKVQTFSQNLKENLKTFIDEIEGD